MGIIKARNFHHRYLLPCIPTPTSRNNKSNYLQLIQTTTIMGFKAWNKPYGRTALAVTKHVHINHILKNHEQTKTTITTGIKRPIYL